ncbi:MAG: restriction endonuclease subunit S [Pseudomonas sp.]
MKTAAYPKYANYSDSGVEWIGQIPSHWKTKRTGFLLDELNARSKDGSEPLLSLSKTQGVIRRDSMAERGGQADSLVGYKIVSENDIVINRMQASNGLLAVSEVTGITSPDYAIYRIKNDAEIRSDIVVALLQQAEYQGEIKRRVKGVMEGFIRLYSDDLFRLPIICAPMQEQHAIAAFLDKKCAKIDEAVRIKEEQIKLLHERRQILIQQAVTRGLNPDAPMKDSGIDWIGKIPAHWSIQRNFTLFRETKNSGNANLPVLSVSIHSGVSREELSAEENIRSIIKIEDRTAYKEVLPGDIAYNMMRAWQGGIGAVHTHGMVSPAYVVARPIDAMAGDYFELLYRTPAFIWQMDANSKGITDFRKRLYWDDFRDLLTIVPPKAEQQQINHYAGAVSHKVDKAISIKRDQITALKEYKTTLINAAVTGKIKVTEDGR